MTEVDAAAGVETPPRSASGYACATRRPTRRSSGRRPSLELVGGSGLQLAIGAIMAVREGRLGETPTPVSPGRRQDDDFALGEEQVWHLIYLDRDVEPGPLADEIFGGETPRAGYHLFSGMDGSEAPDGLDTRLHIELRDPMPAVGP